VDFGLLRSDGTLVAAPRSYRDQLTAGVLERLAEIVPPSVLYARTGIQMMEINTICQLLALREKHPLELEAGHRLLLIPDLLRFWLGAEPSSERTNASTTQMLEPAGSWATDLVEACGVDPSILQPVVDSTSHVGFVTESSRRVALVAGPSHDTAAAVAGTPLDAGMAFISSGTWSLVGLELYEPVIDERARSFNLSNEHGVGGTTRLLRNVMGLWLIQECRRVWATEDRLEMDYDSLMQMASEVPIGGCLIDVDDPSLLRPANMPAAIRDQCIRTGQRPPQSRSETLRAVIDGLALRYRWVVEALEICSGRAVTTIAVMGGGGRNAPLSQATADACGRQVEVGPAEATVLGNLLVQGIAMGRLADLKEGRTLVRKSFPPVVYEPHRSGEWNEMYAHFCGLFASPVSLPAERKPVPQKPTA
jgi:rhamnulokinase